MHTFSILKALLKESSVEIKTDNKTINIKTEKIQGTNEKKFDKQKKKKNLSHCYPVFTKDGDTFVGFHNDEKKTFRLSGINAPEIGTKKSKEATFFLKDKIVKKNIYVDFHGKDKYDREIVTVYLDENKTINLNKIMIEEGFATSEDYENQNGEKVLDKKEYKENEKLEEEAKSKNKGIWN